MRTVGVKLTAETQAYVANVGKATMKTTEFASKSKAEIAKHDASLVKLGNTAKTTGTSVEQAARRMALAERKVADAAGAVRVAEAQLQQLRSRGNATTAQLVRGQQNLAKASHQLVGAQKEAATAADGVKAATQRESQAIQKLDKDTHNARGGLNSLSTGAGLVGAGLLAGVAVMLKSAAGFDKAMSSVAATGSDASKNIDALRKQAIAMGAATKFSATEAAEGIENLLKAGVSTADVLGGGLKGALDLAAAGSMEVGAAAEVAATAMTQFNLTGRDVPHIADLLAAGAGKAQGEVKDMGDALKMSGLVANQFGLSIEETTGTLAAFASAGLLGSDAGTSFKQMLLQLGAPSSKAVGLMADLGIAAYDAQGNFVGMANLAQQLKEKLGPLSQAERDNAMATIFGSDAIRAANVLFNQGAKGITEWTTKVNDAGYAAQVARTKMDNLAGDLETLKGSIETTFIVAGSGANETLRKLTQEATRAVNAVGNMPAPILETGVKLAAFAGIGLLAFAGFGKLTIGLSNTRQAMADLREESPKTAKGLNAISKAASVAAIALATAQIAGAVANELHGKFTPSVDEAAGALLRLGMAKRSGNVGDLNKFFSISTDTVDNIDSAGEALKRATDPRWTDRLGVMVDKFAGTTEGTLTKTRMNLEKVDQALVSLSTDQAADAFRRLAIEARASGVPITELVNLFPQYRDKVRDAANATGRTATSTKELAELMMTGLPPATLESASGLAKVANKAGGVSYEAKQAREQLKGMIDDLFKAARAALELEGSEDGLQAAIDDATQAAKDNGKTVDKNSKQLNNNSDKGRANRAALRNLALASIAYREQLIEQGAKQEKVTRTTEEARKKFIATAEKMGLSTKKAEKLADSFGLVDRKVNSLNDKKVKLKFDTNAGGVAKQFNVSFPRATTAGLAEGGLVHGPGTTTSDSILGVNNHGIATHRISDGEYVVNAASTQKYRPLIEDINADRLAGGGLINMSWVPGGRIPGMTYGVGKWPKAASMGSNNMAEGIGESLGAGIRKSLDKQIGQFGTLPGGGAPSGPGMGALFKYASGLGMGHSTYPGHGEKGMNKAWDFTPVGGGRGNRLAGHAWAHAKNYGIWYVIWNRRIASRTRPGAGWRPYTRYGANASPSQAHTNHVHVSWYGQGTDKARRGLAVVGENGPELVNMRGGEQVRPVNDYRFAGGGMGGSMGGSTVVVNNHYHFDRYVGNRNELVREMNTLKRQNRMDVILK